jgi:hypothetical protein
LKNSCESLSTKKQSISTDADSVSIQENPSTLKRKKIQKSSLLGTKSFLFLMTLLCFICLFQSNERENGMVKIGGFNPSFNHVETLQKPFRNFRKFLKSFNMKGTHSRNLKPTGQTANKFVPIISPKPLKKIKTNSLKIFVDCTSDENKRIKNEVCDQL